MCIALLSLSRKLSIAMDRFGSVKTISLRRKVFPLATVSLLLVVACVGNSVVFRFVHAALTLNSTLHCTKHCLPYAVLQLSAVTAGVIEAKLSVVMSG